MEAGTCRYTNREYLVNTNGRFGDDADFGPRSSLLNLRHVDIGTGHQEINSRLMAMIEKACVSVFVLQRRTRTILKTPQVPRGHVNFLKVKTLLI